MTLGFLAFVCHSALAAYPAPKLKATFSGHTDKVMAAQLDAQETTLFTASTDRSLRTWDLASGAAVKTIATPDAPLYAFALREGGNGFAGGGVWGGSGPFHVMAVDTAAGSIEVMTGHTGSVLALGVSTDGKLVASGSQDGTVIIWDAQTRAVLQTLEPKTPVASLAFTSGGVLIYAPSDRSFRAYDVAAKNELGKVSMPKNVLAVATSATRDRFAAAAASGNITVIEANKGEVAKFNEGTAIVSMAFAPDGETLFAVTQSGDVKQLDVQMRISSMFIRNIKARSISTSRSGKYLVVGTSDGRALVYEHQKVRPPIVLDPQGHSSDITDLAFTPDAQTLVSVSKDKTIRVWDVATGDNIRTIRGFQGEGVDGILYRLAISPDGKDVAVGGFLGPDGSATVGDLRVFSLATGKQRGVLHKGKNTTSGLVWTKTRFFSGNSDTMGRVWDTANFERALTGDNPKSAAFKVDAPVLVTAASPDGIHFLLNEYNQKEPLLLDITTISPKGAPKAGGFLKGKHTREVVAAAFSPDSSTLVTADPYQAFVWNVNGTPRGEFPGKIQLAADSRIVFSADGSMINFGAKVFEFPSGKELSTLEDSQYFTIKTAAFGGNDVVAVAGSRAGKSEIGNDIVLWNPRTGKEIRRLAPRSRRYRGVAFLDNGLGLALVDDYSFLTGPAKFEASAVKTAFDFGRLRVVEAKAAVSNRLVLEANGKTLRRPPEGSGGLDLTTVLYGNARIQDRVSGSSVQAYTILPNGDALVGTNQHLRSYDAGGAEKRRFVGHQGGIISLALSPDGKLAASLGDDSTVRLWRLDDAGEEDGGHTAVRPLVSLFLARTGDWVAWAPDSTYASSKQGGRFLGFHINQGRTSEARFYPFEQYDLRFNRPDLLLERLEVGDPALRKALLQAWKKRVQRMGFSEDMLDKDLTLPKVTLRTPSQSTRDRNLELDFSASSEKNSLDRAQVYINDIPVFGRTGQALGGVKTIDKKLTVPLSLGRNKVQVSVFDNSGQESPRETISVRYDGTEEKPTLYLLAIGVSKYKDKDYNLTYAAKDAQDLAKLLSARKSTYKAVKVQTLTDKKATREEVLNAKSFLAQGGIDDEAVIFFAGHGLLDAQLDYYLAMHDLDFAQPAERGLPYEQLEGLFDGIAARRRLLLIDACNSGEVDKDNAALADAGPSKNSSGVKSRGFKRVVQSQLGLQGSFELVQQLFADLRRTSGAAVISSASGREFAFEAAKWKNGVFTYAMLDGLKSLAADANKDGSVRVSELRDFVIERVQKLTDGQQTPTARRENLELDFPVY